MSEPHSLASGFLHYCSCACIRHLAKLHTVPSGYYSSTRNFQTTRHFPIFVPEYVNATWFFFHLFFCFTYLFSFSWKIIFKARIGEINFAWATEAFFVIALRYSFLTVVKSFCIFNKRGLSMFLVSKVRGRKTADGQYGTTETALHRHVSRCFVTFGMRKTGEIK